LQIGLARQAVPLVEDAQFDAKAEINFQYVDGIARGREKRLF